MPRNRGWRLRALCVAGAWSAVAGCGVPGAEPVSLAHRSVLDVDTHGIALSADGARGHAGMYGVTCDFRTRSGVVGTDYDYPSDEERVQDAIDTDEGDLLTVTSSPDRIHLTRLDTGTSLDLTVPNVRHTRLFADGVVAVRETRGGCLAAWLAFDGTVGAAVDLPSSACAREASVAVNREARGLFVTTDAGVIAVDEGGWAALGVDAERIAWDPWSGRLYGADRASSVVRAWSADGAPRWTVPVEGEVRDVAHLGEVGAAVVSVAVDGGGALLVFDGEAGLRRADEETPTAAEALVVPDSGAIVGLVTGSETHFYEVDVSD